MNEKLFVGLDIGTNSVGWAVTDEEYNLKRLKGKTAWGSRIFQEAKSKKETRNIREKRRRMNRRKYRLTLLQNLFIEEIKKIDSTFFIRLDNASYLAEDKVNKGIGKNLIFKDKQDEIKFYKTYPTIWHLRKALINGEDNALSNLKYIYLAIHHIIKYRGHFLFDGDLSYQQLDEKLIIDLNEYLKGKCDSFSFVNNETDFISSEKTNDLKNILLDKNKNKISKQKSIKELFDAHDDEKIQARIQMFSVIVTGSSYKLSKLDKSYESSICFDSNYEDSIDKIKLELQDDFYLVDIAKRIFDFISLNELLKNNDYLSYAMVKVYEKHKEDLKKLKKIILNIDKNNHERKSRLYDNLFKKDFDNNYAELVNVGTSIKKRIKLEDFNKLICKILEENSQYIHDQDKKDYDYLLKQAKENELLKIIAHVSTSRIPHQLHLNELKIIIENASIYHPFLKEIKEKLILLFQYKIPYTYGPLNSNSPFSNIVRIRNEKATPWNIHELIDENKTREKFMNKLTNNCSYLYGEKVLPKSSLTFETFLILEKLNVMMVNGDYLSFSEKEEVYQYIISSGKDKTTLTQIRSFLASKSNTSIHNILLSNIKENSLFEARSHTHLSKFFNLKQNPKQIEYYIYLATVYADDKNGLKKILEKEHSELTKEQIKCLLTLPTNKWAPLSYKLLNEIYYIDYDTGIALSILQAMKEKNCNFQMLLYHPIYHFNKLIEDYNASVKGDISSDEMIDEILQNVPSISQRSIHQALLVLNDISKASSQNINKIFIEVTRKDDEEKKKKETDSREKEIYNFIQQLSKEVQNTLITSFNVETLQEEFKLLEKTKLKSKHIYLYFKQMGLDMYTGEKISLDDLLKHDNYDIDHIIPQSLIKDDSLDNLVLVSKNINQKVKGDSYPLPIQLQNEKTKKLWKYLLKMKAISDNKYANLMRTSKISLEEIERFVNRQINIINYTNIALRDILKLKYPQSEIIFSKAHYPSFIRNYLQIIKNRNVNDTHHAIDAYLNVFCGNTLSKSFYNIKKIYDEKVIEGQTKTFNMEKILEYELDKKDSQNISLMDKIKSNCLRHDIIVTFKCDYNNGAFYKETIWPHDEKTLIPIHTKNDNPMNNPYKYGGYKDLAQAYLLAVQYENKNKIEKYILRVPLLLDKKYGNDLNELVKYLIKKENAKNIKILRKIYLNQKIKYEKGIYLIYTSNEITNKYKMAFQNYIDNQDLAYLQKTQNKYNEINIDLPSQEFVLNRKGEIFVISKKRNLEIFDKLIQSAKKEVYNTCNYIVAMRDLDRAIFESIDLKKQLNTLNTMINCLSRNNELCKFEKEFTNMPKTFKFLPTMNITDKSITIIYESPTGLFSHEVKI